MARNGRKLAKRKSCQFFKSPDFISKKTLLENMAIEKQAKKLLHFLRVSQFPL